MLPHVFRMGFLESNELNDDDNLREIVMQKAIAHFKRNLSIEPDKSMGPVNVQKVGGDDHKVEFIATMCLVLK